MPELFHFHTRESSNTTTYSWRYTNAKRTKTIDGVAYEPRLITRSRWKRDLSDAELSVKVPADMEPIPFFTTANPPSNLWLTITNLDGHPVDAFIGKVLRCQFKFDRNEAELIVQAASRMLAGEIPRQRFTRGCGWELYGPICAVVRENFRTSVVVADMTVGADGRELTATAIGAQADGYFTRGYVEIGFERAYITKHVGTTLTVLSKFQSPSGTQYDIYPGCNFTRDHCENKFNNLARFGGYPEIPNKNPVVSGF